MDTDPPHLQAEAEEARWRLLQRERWLLHSRQTGAENSAHEARLRASRLNQLVSEANTTAVERKLKQGSPGERRQGRSRVAECAMHERACRQAMEEWGSIHGAPPPPLGLLGPPPVAPPPGLPPTGKDTCHDNQHKLTVISYRLMNAWFQVQ